MATSTPRRFPSYLLLTLLLYFLFIFYLPRCTLPDFPSVSSLTFLSFWSCCNRTTTTWLVTLFAMLRYFSAGSWRYRGLDQTAMERLQCILTTVMIITVPIICEFKYKMMIDDIFTCKGHPAFRVILSLQLLYFRWDTSFQSNIFIINIFILNEVSRNIQ